MVYALDYQATQRPQFSLVIANKRIFKWTETFPGTFRHCNWSEFKNPSVTYNLKIELEH